MAGRNSAFVSEEMRVAVKIVRAWAQLLGCVHGEVDVNVLRVICAAYAYVLVSQDGLLDVVLLRVPRALHAFEELLEVCLVEVALLLDIEYVKQLAHLLVVVVDTQERQVEDKVLPLAPVALHAAVKEGERIRWAGKVDSNLGQDEFEQLLKSRHGYACETPPLQVSVFLGAVVVVSDLL